MLAELVKQRLVEKVLDVLGVVEGCCGGGALRDLLLVAGLTRVDTCMKLLGCPLWQKQFSKEL
jgi:hypothetical protein